MSLSKSISDASQQELKDLARYMAGELAMETLDIAEDVQFNVPPDTIENILKAWAFTQRNNRDGSE